MLQIIGQRFGRRATAAALIATVCLMETAIAQTFTQSAQSTQSKQGTPGVPRESSSPVWDVTGLLGWRGVRMVMEERPTNRVDYDSRTLAGAIVGRHWTPHLKTELEIGTTAPSEVLSFSPVDVDLPGLTYQPFIYRNHRIRDTVVSAGGLYQFGEDAWFHPHVGGGVEIARTSDEVSTMRQTVSVGPTGPPVVIAEDSRRSDTTVATRGFVSSGFKAYATERLFLRADVRVAAGQRPANVTARFGVGYDFGARPARATRSQSRSAPTTQASAQKDQRYLASYAHQLPAGSRVKVRMKSGESFKATLMGVEGDEAIVKPRTRHPSPERRVALADVEFIEPEPTGQSGSTSRVVGISVAVAAGSVAAIILLLNALYND